MFKYLERNYRHGIKLMVFEGGGDAIDGEDVYSEGIATLIEIVDRSDFVLTCKLSTLFYAICNKKWKQVLDKNKAARNYHTRHNEDTVIEDFSEDMDHTLYSDIFWECFNKLEKICRQILKAYFKEIPAREIADLFDLTYGYLRKKKSMCHTALMKIINMHPDYLKIKNKDLARTELSEVR
jgi:DNA-directed RNA polymerase specialized sigma24 family protein